jgi:hypothetical protein
MNFQHLDHPIRWLFLFHAVGGALALFIFVIPLATRKGGKLHVRTGWIYTGAMIFVGLSAWVITPWRIFFDSARTPSSVGFAIFLAFIVVFTFSSLWDGLHVLKHKARTVPSPTLANIGPPLLVMMSGLFTQALGVRLHSVLLMVFPLISYVGSYQQIRYWSRAPTERMHWWYVHMSGMITACIATVTAFLVTAAPRIWPNELTRSPLLWIAPGIILGQLAKKWKASYKQKFELTKGDL